MLVEQMFALMFSNFLEPTGNIVLVRSQLSCAAACTGVEDCSSFFYNPDSRSCLVTLQRHFTSAGLVAAAGYKYYMARSDCDQEWAVFGMSCYWKSPVAQNVGQARVTCINKGGLMASTNTPNENRLIKKEFGSGFWIGGSDEVEEGKWIWPDGQPVTLNYWAEGQPDNGSSDHCMEQWGHKEGWNDGPCWFPLSFLCEK
ncbi:galactose-specific lectin nattectin-like [Haliotis rufescens]|uniref:galactose-specific lectin nattectin-like n=1 Tax=Haliotis rufescens TaxID=6454 RepID=UPI00201F3EC4|nr:galactose-specific lectin nattectin-like [Haliotis rufescens]